MTMYSGIDEMFGTFKLSLESTVRMPSSLIFKQMILISLGNRKHLSCKDVSRVCNGFQFRSASQRPRHIIHS
jgi:hypothetical protein